MNLSLSNMAACESNISSPQQLMPSSGTVNNTALSTPLPAGSSRPSSQQMATPAPDSPEDAALKVLQFLRENGMKEAEEVFLKDAQAKGLPVTSLSGRPPSSLQPIALPTAERSAADLQALLAEHENKNDPSTYFSSYDALVNFVENSLDRHKPELGTILYPVFAHMYLELIINKHKAEASDFMEKYGKCQETFWDEHIQTMQSVATEEHIESNLFLDTLRKCQFVIRLSKESSQTLRALFLANPMLMALMKKRMQVETLDMPPRSADNVDSLSGGLLGEPVKTANKNKVLYGLLKEGDLLSSKLEDGSQPEADTSSVSKKKKAKTKEGAAKEKGRKGDPNAPPNNRIPLPELTDSLKTERKQAGKEKRAKITPDHLPSVCFYTFLNAQGGVSSCDLSDDSTLLLAGYGNSTVQAFSLNETPLKVLKPASDLENIDKFADDVNEQIYETDCASSKMTMSGHSGPVYGVSVAPDKRLFLSCSEDATIRLWSLQMWSNLVIYRSGGYPVWCVDMSGSGDGLALVWATDRTQPLRFFAGHYGDVNCVRYHPNCNYVATGGADRCVRLWDVSNGQCVRYFTAHKGGVHSLEWSPDGRYLASGGSDGVVNVFDVGSGRLLGCSSGAQSTSVPKRYSRLSDTVDKRSLTVQSLAYSRDGAVLAAGGLDNAVRLFHMPSITIAETKTDSSVPLDPKIDPEGFEIALFPTKSTPVLGLQFTRRNLLIGAGSFDQ